MIQRVRNVYSANKSDPVIFQTRRHHIKPKSHVTTYWSYCFIFYPYLLAEWMGCALCWLDDCLGVSYLGWVRGSDCVRIDEW